MARLRPRPANAEGWSFSTHELIVGRVTSSFTWSNKSHLIPVISSPVKGQTRLRVKGALSLRDLPECDRRTQTQPVVVKCKKCKVTFTRDEMDDEAKEETTVLTQRVYKGLKSKLCSRLPTVAIRIDNIFLTFLSPTSQPPS